MKIGEKMLASEEIRKAIKENNLKQWEVCAILGISEGTFIRWLRFPMSEEKKNEIITVIKQNRKDG